MKISTKELKKIIMEEYARLKEKDGLYANIHKKRARGEKPAKPGDEDYPDEKSWDKAAKSKKTNENEFAGMPFDDDEQEEHEQVAIEKKHIEDSVEEMLIHISKTEVENFLGGLAAKLGADDMQRVSIKEGQPVMYPDEQAEIAKIVEPVVQAGGGIQEIGDAIEQAGYKVQRGYRYIMTKVKYAQIAVASVNNVELEGNETIIGQFAVGEM